MKVKNRKNRIRYKAALKSMDQMVALDLAWLLGQKQFSTWQGEVGLLCTEPRPWKV